MIRRMGYRLVAAADAFWRPSNQMSVLNTDSEELLRELYPDGPKALPPELEG
jgi:hypothetical protein